MKHNSAKANERLEPNFENMVSRRGLRLILRNANNKLIAGLLVLDVNSWHSAHWNGQCHLVIDLKTSKILSRLNFCFTRSLFRKDDEKTNFFSAYFEQYQKDFHNVWPRVNGS